MRQAIFLDRDGTIIEDEHYLRDPARVRLLAHAAEGMQMMQAVGFDLFLVTNQSGVARGYMTEQDVHAVNDELQRQLRERGVHFRDVRYCPHLQGCSCRKPQPGMLLDLASRHGIDLSRSVMIGDKHADVQAGLNAGCYAIMVGAPGNDDLLSIAKRLKSEEVLS